MTSTLDPAKVAHVYEAIVAITAAMSREGISKGRKNEQQGYRFRGIDEVYNALSAHLARERLCILPRVLDRTVTERPTKSGGVSTYVVLTVEFDLVSGVDGSRHTIRTMGEAMDSADKATNKAMSAAMKYACLMAFQIPTEGDNDADAHTTDLAPTLANSVAGNWPQWRERLAGRLKGAKTLGDLREEWSVIMSEADRLRVPKEHVEWLALVKDRAKLEMAEPQGPNGARA